MKEQETSREAAGTRPQRQNESRLGFSPSLISNQSGELLMTRTSMLTKKLHLLSQYAAALFTVLLTVAACETTPAAFAQGATAQALAGNGGPEGSWIYTVTIPGYTFTGI